LSQREDLWLAAGVREGEVVDRKYRIDQVLGVGGMGVVVAAQHLRLGRVALKFLLPSALENHEAVARFAEEARVLSAIRSEHVVTVFDVGELPNGAPYMVMEYLEGEDLASRVRKGGALPVEETVGFVLQACVAVAEAHRIAVVHRDLKPSNLFCIRASDGEVLIKLLDFGISKNVARVASGEMGSMTQTNAVMGTPLYMSPEQLRNAKDVDGRADLWALGAILFELLTGRPPFVGSTVTELTVNIMTTPTPRLSSYRPDAPNGLQAIIDRCLEKDRAVRIGSVAELAVALLPFGSPNARTPVKRISAILRGREPSPPITLASGPTGSPETVAHGSVSPWSGTQGTSRRSNAFFRTASLLGASLVLLVAIGWFVLPLWSRIRESARRDGKAAPIVEAGALATEKLESAAGAAGTVPSIGTSLAEATPPPECQGHETSCRGHVPQSCGNGSWVSGAVTKGACGAVCTPGVTGPRCKNASRMEACSSEGQWEDGASCGKDQTCRDGSCLATAPTPPASANCRIVSFFDNEGNQHFRQQCGN
jgi:eukaryotic-like serine/threonine-protein kinase